MGVRFGVVVVRMVQEVGESSGLVKREEGTRLWGKVLGAAESS